MSKCELCEQLQALILDGHRVETVSSFNYLGTFIDNHYNFVENADYEAIKRQCRDCSCVYMVQSE